MATQRLEIVTPEKKVFSGDVTFVVVPGEAGQLGFLPNHAPLVSGLKNGEIRVEQDGKKLKFNVNGGFVEVRNSRVVVLADSAEKVE